MRAGLLRQFLTQESAGGIILFVMAVFAMIWSNSPLSSSYEQIVGTSLFAINDGLMAIFFLVVGLELKREYLLGELSHLSRVLLPLVAAIGGMIVPMGIYWVINHAHVIAIKGWSIPVATDIAFALGLLSLFGRRIPTALKLFLLALAIFDDIGAIMIIGFYYTQNLSYLYLVSALGLLLLLGVFNVYSVQVLTPYLIVGFGLWVCLLYSGIHPTIAGVVLAFTIPVGHAEETSPLHRLEGALSGVVSYCILPLFALVNAGFVLSGLTWHVLLDTVVLGVILGLFIGKQIGVFGFTWVMIRFFRVKPPQQTSFLALYGVALLCGIGFTMSLFLGTLSFENESIIYLAKVRLGVMMGSLLSGFVGSLVLLVATKERQR